MNAPGKVGTVASPVQIMKANLQARENLLAGSPRMRKSLGNFTSNGVLGGTTRVKLFNVGITTKIILDVIATFDIGTATATVSPKAPYNLINRIKVTDFDGVDRINASGFQAWMWQCARKRKIYGYNNESQSAVLTSPLVPTAVATGTVLRFQLELPLAYNDGDLRGALLTQTAVGEAFLNLDWNTIMYANGNDDAVYHGAATTTAANVVIQCNVEQEYLLPQSISGPVTLPMIDLMTVYEYNGVLKSSDNIAVGSEKLINYPNLRSVLALYVNYMNNGVMNAATTDISKFRLIANGNNVIREYSPVTKLLDMRDWLLSGGDTRPGAYWEQTRDRPVETALFGNVQYGITPLTAGGGNQYMEIGVESFYTKGQALPGMMQTS